MASRVDNLYFFIVAVTAFFAVVVSVLVIVFAAKYHTKDPLAVGQPIHGSMPLELAWSDATGTRARLRSRSLRVPASQAILTDLRALLGDERVRLVRGS